MLRKKGKIILDYTSSAISPAKAAEAARIMFSFPDYSKKC